MRRKFPRLLWVGWAACVVLAAGGIFLYEYEKSLEPLPYFSNAERTISEDVIVKGVMYHVEAGVVTTASGTEPPQNEQLQVFELAYALALAHRSPLLDLTGTDPDKLASGVEQLKRTQSDLAAVQTSTSSAASIAELYPVHFLGALANLERARQKFLASGSDVDEQNYQSLLTAALAAGSSDAQAYATSLAAQMGTTSFSVMTFGGAESPRSLTAAAVAEEAWMQKLAAESGQRTDCIAGDVSRCDQANLELPTIPILASSHTSDPALVQQVEKLVSTTFPKQRFKVYELSSSSCLSIAPGPYDFAYEPASSSTKPSFFFYLGDLYFETLTPSAVKSSPFSENLKNNYNISYMNIDPVKFYQCPALGDDFARVKALAAIEAFASTHPDIATSLRTPLLGPGPVTESNALAYLNAALKDEASSTSPERDDLTALALMYNDRSAGLDDIVLDIALIDAHHAKLVQQGTPFIVSAFDLYLTSSAAPTLFLSDTPAAGTTTLALILNPQVISAIGNEFSTYSQLRTSVPQSVIEHDFNAMEKFEDPF